MKTNWKTVGDTNCDLLKAVYVDERERFQEEAAKRKITVEQMAAAAITEMVRQMVGK
jgi:hypothetical protein